MTTLVRTGRTMCAGLGVAFASIGLTMPCTVVAYDHSRTADKEARVQYVRNDGQWPGSVRFKAAFPTSAMFLQNDGVTWVRMQDDAADLVHEYIQWTPEQQAAFTLRGHAWKMHFVDANMNARTDGEDRRTESHNYFIGNDPAKWAARVPVFEGVQYEQLWPGIDLHWYSSQAQVKYDLLVAAGSDPSRIVFRYEGLEALGVDENGNLMLRTSVGSLTEMEPVAWYADDCTPVACSFTVSGDRVGFDFPKGIDPTRAVVIDPLLMGATYSGQVGASNYGHCSTFDGEGNMYGGAQNFGVGFPVTLGAFQSAPGGGFGTDIVVNKFTPDATTLIWATYIGGGADDKPHSMIVNSSNELCILGSSTGAGFPTSAGAYDATTNGASDIVVVHLNNTATALVGSTYLGGAAEDGRQSMTNNYGDTYRGEIMLDVSENIYIASSAHSSDFPTTTGAYQPALAGGQDAVVVGISPDCSTLLMSTFLGGTQDDNGLGLRFDGLGGLYVCGATESTDFPMPAGGYQSTHQGGSRDGYVVRFANNGSSLAVGTFFGTGGMDMAYFIDLDSEGDVFLYGQTTGEVPIEPVGIYGQASGGIFVTSLNPELSATIFTTALGATMAPVAFLVDVCDHIYISGYNPSGTWETTPDALYEQGFSQFYLAAYDVDMAGILFGTYYGGSHVDGGTSRFDKSGVIYQGVCSGGQSMPTTPDAYATTNNVGWDLGVFKIDFQQSGVVANVSATATVGCAPAPITFTAVGNAPYYVWDLGDGTILLGDTLFTYTYDSAGVYTVMLIGTDSTSCNVADTAYVIVTISDPTQMQAQFTADPISSCQGYAVQLNNTSTGSNTIVWDLGGGNTSTDPDPLIVVSGPGTYEYTILLIDPICQDTMWTTNSVVVPPASLDIDLTSPAYICADAPTVITAGPGFDAYSWSTGEPTESISVDEPGDYAVEVTLGLCAAADTIEVLQAPLPPTMMDVTTCPGESVVLAVPFATQAIVWSTGAGTTTIAVVESGFYSFIAIDGFGCTIMDTVMVDILAASDAEAIVPNVFTPNGDGVNDRFEVRGLSVQDFSMEIYNRWGQLMYKTKDASKGWKGSVDNASDQNVPDGTYYYIVTYTDKCADVQSVDEAGHVTLLR